MARSLNYWQQLILDKIQDTSDLSALDVITDNEKATLSNVTSTSKVSIWRMFVWIVAFAIFTFDLILEIYRQELEELVRQNRPHGIAWYKRIALAFQYGDVLNANDEYDVIDITKQVVKQVAIVKGDRMVTVKIATLDGDELVKIADNNIVLAFSSYMEDNVDAGSELEIVNDDADKLKVILDFYYDPLLMTSDGTVINTSIIAVPVAIKDYLKSNEFNGTFDLNNMSDYLQKVTGYKSMKLNYVGFKAGNATSFTQIDRIYEPLSGYMKLDELTVNYHASL